MEDDKLKKYDLFNNDLYEYFHQKPHHLGFWGVIKCCLSVALMAIILWWRAYPFPYLLFTTFCLLLLVNSVHVFGEYVSTDKITWSGWIHLIAFSLNLYVLHFASTPPDDYLLSVAFWWMPAVFFFVWVIACSQINGFDGAEFAFLSLLIPSWFSRIFEPYEYGHDIFCAINDCIFLVLFIIALFFLKMALTNKNKNQKKLALPFPVVCFCLCYTERLITGFYGFKFIIELFTSRM